MVLGRIVAHRQVLRVPVAHRQGIGWDSSPQTGFTFVSIAHRQGVMWDNSL